MRQALRIWSKRAAPWLGWLCGRADGKDPDRWMVREYYGEETRGGSVADGRGWLRGSDLSAVGCVVLEGLRSSPEAAVQGFVESVRRCHWRREGHGGGCQQPRDRFVVVGVGDGAASSIDHTTEVGLGVCWRGSTRSVAAACRGGNEVRFFWVVVFNDDDYGGVAEQVWGRGATKWWHGGCGYERK
ncbi:DNA-directed RNA polymerase II subunit 1 [Iris pallida]|uniref:DNA-directed RNA polymerase II subunit 1 n=1 Tax=Iris pallida TaxID=29817 RepID=A0AAX6GZP8_IRIPA|nr:DNA-directed RNA polymerase II subunit 1 [Iris pallida]